MPATHIRVSVRWPALSRLSGSQNMRQAKFTQLWRCTSFVKSPKGSIENSTSGPDHAMERVMLAKAAVSVAVGLALCAATLRLPAVSCALSNVSSPVACKPGCCANKACCETSHEHTGAPSQPFAKSGQDQQNLATPPAAVAALLLNQTPTKSLVFSSVEGAVHSQPPLEVICIRLI